MPTITSVSYDARTGKAEIKSRLSGNAENSFTVSLTSEEYNKFFEFAKRVETRVQNFSSEPSSSKNAEISTGTMIALLKLKGEGVDLDETLSSPILESIVDCCVSNQMMSHDHLANALVLELNGPNIDGKSSMDWRSKVITTRGAQKHVAVPVLP